MQKALISFGFLWIVVWTCFGFYMGSQNADYLNRMQEIASSGSLQDYYMADSAWRYQVHMHSHTVFYAVLAILAALSFPYLGLGQKLRASITFLYIIGNFLFAPLLWIYSGNLAMSLQFLSAVIIIAATALVVIGLVSKVQVNTENWDKLS